MNLPRLSITDRYILKDLRLEQSAVLPAGKVWYCRGRKILAAGTVEALPQVMSIPRGADTLCVSAADYPAIKEWIG